MTDFVLPTAPSDLIELALSDLVKCERSPKYVIDMGNWYVPNWNDGEQCSVCLAGAVMAKHLGNSPFPRIPNHYGREVEGALSALDNFRQGAAGYAFYFLGLPIGAGVKFSRDIVEYEDSPGLFKRQMRKLARDLRAEGY